MSMRSSRALVPLCGTMRPPARHGCRPRMEFTAPAPSARVCGMLASHGFLLSVRIGSSGLRDHVPAMPEAGPGTMRLFGNGPTMAAARRVARLVGLDRKSCRVAAGITS